MLVNMMVKNHITSTKPLITGDIDEVRVQSEEPNLKSLLLKRAFLFSFSPPHRKNFEVKRIRGRRAHSVP